MGPSARIAVATALTTETTGSGSEDLARSVRRQSCGRLSGDFGVVGGLTVLYSQPYGLSGDAGPRLPGLVLPDLTRDDCVLYRVVRVQLFSEFPFKAPIMHGVDLE